MKIRAIKMSDTAWKKALKNSKKRFKEGDINSPNRSEYIRYLLEKDSKS